MSEAIPQAQLSEATSQAQLSEAIPDDLHELLETLHDGVVEREQQRVLLGESLQGLRSLRFGAARLPVAAGGEGIDLETLFARLIRVSTADSNLGHVWRGHIAFVEELRCEGFDSERAAEWFPRLARGDFVGNAQSERHELAELQTVLERRDGLLLLNGTKYYTTGSIYADWIHLAALEGTERVSVTVSTDQPGVRSVDDWDGFGQPLTGSGTTTFDGARVDPAHVMRGDDRPWRGACLGSVFQLSLLAVLAGIAERARRDTIDYVMPRRRTVGFAGERRPREDPLVQQIVGEISGAASAARRIVLSIARDLDAALAAVERAETQPLREVLFDVYRAQRTVPELVLGATTRLFEVGGGSAVGRGTALDRHWRNARTIASHNPVAQRTRAIGEFELTGALPAWTAPGAPEREKR